LRKPAEVARSFTDVTISDPDIELARASDEMLAEVVTEAVIHPLLLALAAALDDRSLIPDQLKPDDSNPFDPNGGLSPEQLDEARGLAVAALARLRDDGPAPGRVAADATDARPRPLPLAVDELRPLLDFVSDGAPVDHYLDLLREELALGEDLRTPSWHKDTVAPDRAFRVVVIGAGMSGLVAAHRLRQAGLDVVVVDKNADVGGTWFENQYPGCRVDVNNHFYSYSFAQRRDWPENFSSQPVLLDYFRRFADDNGLRPLIRFDTEVAAIELDESTMRWTLQLLGPDGAEESLTADAVVSGVGQLNRPNLPDIPGLERFAGPAFHSARWDPDVDLAGKRVAVIGTGASAAQLIPVVAERAGSLEIFQRTPAWFIPTPEYHDPVTPGALWLFEHVPGYANWFRFWIFWKNVEGLLGVARVDPEWDGGGRSVSAMNEFVRTMLAGYIEGQLADRPDLAAHVVPDYPPFAKRFIRDNGIWADTLKRDDVALVTEGIAEITPDGILTRDGELHEADVLIYGTGFQASDFLMPMKVVGRGGVELHERWGGDARAYLGITLPGFPNLFLLYGPNTNIVANGSITYFSECEVFYLVEALGALLAQGARALDPKAAVHDAYNEKIDAENLRMAWGVSSVNSWYKNATGRSAQNWPFTLLEYWQQTRAVDLDDYELL
jgi:4-hydroxyacetophenone monooxygenase